ncbi:MAG: GHMP kinase [Treponema sp.]|nr:GHMP kinase [Treponema sp.]
MSQTYTYHSFCPYRVCPLGAHVDHQHGLVTGFAIDKGVTFDYSATDDGSIDVSSANYSGEAIGTVTSLPERAFTWGDFLFGAVFTLRKSYEITHGIKGIVSGSLPVGGLSSSAAVILTYLMAIARANDIHLTAPELIKLAIDEERNYIGVNVGKLDQSCEVYCRKDNLLFLDTLDDSSRLIPENPVMPPFEIAIIFSGMERKLAGSAYNMRVDECKAASYALKGFAHLDYGKFAETYLRDVPKGIYEQYRDRLPENWQKRAEHYYSENERVKQGVECWKKGDIVGFGSQIFASGESSIKKYETGSPELQTLFDIMRDTDGIYGGRFSGAGFNGSSMAIIDPSKKEQISEHITSEYLKYFPNLKSSFGICYCATADGITIT